MGVACCADAVVDENDKMNYNLILTVNDKDLGILIFFLFLFHCISNSFQLCLSLSVPPNGSGMLC